VLGYAHDDLIGRSFSTFIHPQDLHKNEAAFAEASSLPIGGATSNVQFRVRHATGVWLWMETIGTNLLGDSAVKGIVINGRDVTETVNLSRGLQTLSQANQVLVRAASEATLLSEICDTIVDSGYPLAWVGFADSDRRVRVVGAAGETSALENLEISWGDDEYGSGPIGTAIKTGATQFINDIRTEASCDPWRERFEEFGLQSACAMPLSVDGDVIGAVMIYSHESGTFDARSAEMLQELTANLAYGIGRLRERNLLGEREALLREAEQLAHVGHWRWTPSQGHIEFLADGIFEIYGTTRKEWLGTVASLLSFVPFAERQGVADALDRAATGEIVEWYNTLQRPDEVIRQIRTRTSTIRDSEGRIEAILGACLDYTEQAMSNDGLLFQAQLLDNAGQAIIAVDNSRSISYWNRAAESLFGWRAVEVAGRSIDVVMSTESSSEQLASIAVALESEGSWQGELIVRHNNGKLIQVSVTDTPSLDGVGLRVGFIRVASDLSERRALEMRLDQAQRLESLGLLAGGVAHDFNNLLTVILNHGAFIERDPDRDARQHAHHIVSAGEAAARLTRQLLTFARREPIRVELLDLNQVMSDTKELLSRTIGDHIRFEVRTGDPATVLVDRSQLEQVLVNLAVNACDAMPSGGILTFDTGVVDLDENYAKLNPDVMPGSYGQIVVSDTGHGMSPEVMDHAFDPFYSTKALEGGTGLGLATVYGIAKAAGGHINLYSEIGVGTTVRVYFPIEEGLVVPHPPSSNASHHVRQGATVLIVEDLDPLREVACELIRSNGYVVLEASTPAEAIALATSHRIDLLLTDVMMPEMSGPALAELLASSNVDMSVVYMSGYSADFLGHHGNLDPDVLLVQKPFTEATLLQAVDVALGNRSTMDEPEVTQIGN
jgi:PAS domain S-box-containing protein